MFACPPTLLSYNTLGPYNQERLIHCRRTCMASCCNAGNCVVTLIYSVVPQHIFLQGKEAIGRVVQGLHFCSLEERLTGVLGEHWSATKGLSVKEAHSLPDAGSCQLVTKFLSVPNEQILSESFRKWWFVEFERFPTGNSISPSCSSVT